MFRDYDTFRQWFYGVATAAGAVLSGYGVISQEQAQLWLGLALAIVGSVASTNVRNKRGTDSGSNGNDPDDNRGIRHGQARNPRKTD